MEAGEGFGSGFGTVLGFPIDAVRVLPDLMRDRSITLPSRAAGLAGSLAGLGTLGYGAYRGGKALLHKMTSDDDND